MDLDDILNDVLGETPPPPVAVIVAPKVPTIKKPAESAEIKPFLGTVILIYMYICIYLIVSVFYICKCICKCTYVLYVLYGVYYKC